ncbi:MAG: hypothetical protein JXQ76_07240 [Campylobacterales bacterium]|nr:hypothetical protein [Campylobacterales bacterium]
MNKKYFLFVIFLFYFSITTLHAKTQASFYTTLVESFEKSSWGLYEKEIFPSFATYKQRFHLNDDKNTTKKYEDLRQKAYLSWQNVVQQLPANASLHIIVAYETLICPTKDVRTRCYKHTVEFTANEKHFTIELHPCFDDDRVRCYGVLDANVSTAPIL